MTKSKLTSNRLPGPFTGKGRAVNVVIETPRGCRNKFVFDERFQIFRLKSVLPAGAAFPYDFGFVPGTKADDGDPVDVLVLMDEPAFTGCLISSRLIGVLVAEQVKNGSTIRNDRLIAVARSAQNYRDLRSLRDMNRNLVDELIHFFESYNEMKSRDFKLVDVRGKKYARRLVEKSAIRTTNATSK